MARIGTRRATLGLESLRWSAVVGTLQVSGGALQAATMGAWGANIVSNGEFTTNTTGWSASAVMNRRDFATAPDIDPTGGADNYGVELASDGVANRLISQGSTTLSGASYAVSARAYAPSGNTGTNAAGVRADTGSVVTVSSEDAWQTITTAAVVTDTDLLIRLYNTSATGGDVAYWDKVEAYRRNAVALLRGWVSPDFEATLAHISPASAVTPFGFIVRYTDSLNYWEVRILPNTAGNDLQIVQVTAGVETIRAEADVDWTAGDTDYIKITAKGATISTAHMKHGESSYTAGPSYASATQGQTSAQLGVMFYSTGTIRVSSLVLKRA